MEMQRAAADTHAVFFVNGKSEVQTPNNHTQTGDQNFHNKLPPQWLKSLQALLWAFQSSFHRSLSPLWDYKTDNFFGCNGTPNTLMLRGSIGASYLHPLQCILPAEEFGAARSSKDFALAIKTLSAKWSFLVFNLHLPHGDEYGCTKKKNYQISTEVSCVGKCQNIKMEDLRRKCVHSAISLRQSCTTSCCWPHGLPQQQCRPALSLSLVIKYL